MFVRYSELNRINNKYTTIPPPLLTTVPAQGILKFTRSSVRSEVATEVVVASHLKILVPDTVDVVAVGGLGDVNLALVDQFLK
jgi:hypothetical protein